MARLSHAIDELNEVDYPDTAYSGLATIYLYLSDQLTVFIC